MKNKILLTSVLMLALVATTGAHAANSNDKAGEAGQVQQQTQTANQGETDQIRTQNVEQTQNEVGGQTENKVQQQVQQQNQEDNRGEDTQIKTQNQEQVQQQEGESISEEHRSDIANFVQSLLQIADSEGGIGQQVREIAQQQNQSTETTIQAIEKVQTKSKVKTFFFGSDYKNLGTLRSEMVQTQNRIEQLNQLIESVQNAGNKTELQNQIQTLEQEQTKIESFIEDNESKFSLFGWLVKLFSK